MIALLLALTLVQDPDLKIEKAEKEFADKVATTSNFEIATDATEKPLREAVEILESHLRSFLVELKDLIHEGEDESRMKVNLDATYESFTKTNPMANGAGGFYDSQAGRLPLPMQQPRGDDWTWVLRHEAMHQLLHRKLGIGGMESMRRGGGMPSPWFNEGFASYWAGTSWKDGKVFTGGIPKKLLDECQAMKKGKGLLPLKKLFSSGPMMGGGLMMGGDPKAIYAQGWALCHFLRHAPKYAPKFAGNFEDQREVRTGLEAFKERFGIDDVSVFERNFSDYVGGLKAAGKVY